MQQSLRNLMPQRLKLTATNEAEEEKFKKQRRNEKGRKHHNREFFLLQ
jgi:hypothetical protein